MNQLPLTLEEAIERALQNNNDIDTSRNDVQIAEFNLRGARGVYDPLIASENYYESATTPVASRRKIRDCAVPMNEMSRMGFSYS